MVIDIIAANTCNSQCGRVEARLGGIIPAPDGTTDSAEPTRRLKDALRELK
ncbi:MAG: hypothetical protein M3O31_10595 [Acidobacteriota bacterium]|nr:hypothetical protein [Acidobacteriota bacterium]